MCPSDLLNSLRSDADAAMKSLRWEEASTAWARIRSLLPNDPAAYIAGSEALLQSGRQNEADELANDALQRFPESLPVAHTHAGLAGKRGDLTEALRRWERVKERFPDDAGSRANSAYGLIGLGRFDEAVPILVWLVEKRPDLPDGWIGFATLAMKRAAWAEAIRGWEPVRERFPALTVGYGAAVEALFNFGQVDAADAMSQEGILRFPDDRWLAHLHAGLASRRGDGAAALKRWLQVKKAFPNDHLGFEQYAHCLRVAGRLQEAQDAFAEVVLRFPDRQEAFVLMCDVAMQRQSWAEAAVLWTEARRRFPHRTEGFSRGATALRRARLDALADQLIEDGAKQFPESVDLAIERLEMDLNTHLMSAQTLCLWRQCAQLGGVSIPHFLTLSWRVFLNLADERDANEVLDLMLSDSTTATQEAVPALVFGLSRMLQSADKRFSKVHKVISAHLTNRLMAGKGGPQELVRALLGLLGWPEVIEIVRKHLLADPSRVTKILVSSFEGHQFAACGAQSHAGSALATVLHEFLEQLKCGKSPPTAAMSFNALYYAFASDVALFRDISALLRPIVDICIVNNTNEIWQSVAEICTAADFRGHNRLSFSKGDTTTVTARTKRLRIALCISGQLRGYRQAHDSWNRLLLECHNVTSIVHVWRNVGRQGMALASTQRGFPSSFVEPYNLLVAQVGLNTLRVRFPSFFAAFETRIDVNEADLRDIYKTDYVFIEDDDKTPYLELANAQKMYTKVQRAHDFARSLRNDFDLFIRIRPDKIIAGSDQVSYLELLQESTSDRKLFCDYGPVLSPSGELLVGDQFALGCEEVMDVYARTLDWTQTRAREFFGAEKKFAGHINFASSLLFQGVTAGSMRGIRFGGLCDPEGLSLERIAMLVKHDVYRGPRDEIAITMLRACGL